MTDPTLHRGLCLTASLAGYAARIDDDAASALCRCRRRADGCEGEDDIDEPTPHLSQPIFEVDR